MVGRGEFGFETACFKPVTAAQVWEVARNRLWNDLLSQNVQACDIPSYRLLPPPTLTTATPSRRYTVQILFDRIHNILTSSRRETPFLAPPAYRQIVVNHIETAYSEISNAITMAVTLRKPVFIGIASNLATAKHPSLATEPFAFS